MGVCAVMAGVSLLVAAGDFTLAWTHSVQKLRWEEDWQVREGRLWLVAARVQGPGAGMEAPPDAQWREGAWHYRPAVPPQAALRLANSAYGDPYEICVAGRCRVLPPDEAGTTLLPCPG